MLEIYSLYISNCINRIFLQLTEVPGMVSISDQGSTRQHTILDLSTYVSYPELHTHLCIVNEISIYLYVKIPLDVQFYDVGLVCSGHEIVCISTPEGYSFSRKLYGINVRNLSTPPRTWYFLNSQRHEVNSE